MRLCLPRGAFRSGAGHAVMLCSDFFRKYACPPIANIGTESALDDGMVVQDDVVGRYRITGSL